MKYLLNGREWSPIGGEGAEVTQLADRLLVRTARGEATALVVRAGGATYVSYKGRSYKVERAGRSRHHTGPDSGGEARAPMPGQIVEVSVEAGATVTRGERLMVLEAMKMQQPVVAPLDGIVKSVPVAKGDQVAEGQVLAVVEAE